MQHAGTKQNTRGNRGTQSLAGDGERQFLGQCQSLGNSNSSVCTCLATDTTAYYIIFPIDSNQKTFYGSERCEVYDGGVVCVLPYFQSQPE